MKATNKTLRIPRHILLRILPILFMLFACDEYLEIEPPENQLTGPLVFEEESTVDAAFAYIYAGLRDQAFTNGTPSGLSYLMGHYTDELDLYSNNLPEVQHFNTNSVLPSDSGIKAMWDTAYNLVHATNSILEGVEASSTLSELARDRFTGEAYFLRAFIHFYLTNLFGPVPYLDSTDYRMNSEVSRLPETEVYQRLVSDLQMARNLMPAPEGSGMHFRPDRQVATALLARVYLYQEDWPAALEMATDVISNGGYTLNTDLSRVFLVGSTETIWQLDSGSEGSNTREAATFVFVTGPPPNSALSAPLLESFEAGDLRFTYWTGSISEDTLTWYFTNKYKQIEITGNTEECSILIRLAECYLIAAEAHTQMDQMEEALSFINPLRERANLASLTLTSRGALLEAILQERRIEFFSEHGHRFFDLKRAGKAGEKLSPVKANWQDTDLRLPLPDTELALNPNLLPQNEGY